MAEAIEIRPDPAWRVEVEAYSGECISRCYQCRKCTNGCPVTYVMDLMPNQIMRMVQLGLRDEVLRSRTIWICAACQTCTSRCPNDIDITHVMDSLRQLSYAAGIEPAEKRVAAFHSVFLDSIRRHGRVYELGLVARYKMVTRDPFGHLRVGWGMFKRGKLKFLPKNIKDKGAIRALFRKQRKD